LPDGAADLKSCEGGRHNMPHPLQVDLWPFDLESGVWVACDVGYLCANCSLPRPLCSRLRPDVRFRQTSNERRASSLNAPPRGWGITRCVRLWAHCMCLSAIPPQEFVHSFIHSFIVSLIMPLDKTQWTTRRNTNMRHGVSKNNILKTDGVKLN